MGPRRAEVARRPHRRPEPLVAAGGVDRAGLGIANDMIERPVLAIGPTRLPAFAGGIAFENERALLGSDEREDFFRHRSPPF